MTLTARSWCVVHSSIENEFSAPQHTLLWPQGTWPIGSHACYAANATNPTDRSLKPEWGNPRDPGLGHSHVVFSHNRLMPSGDQPVPIITSLS